MFNKLLSDNLKRNITNALGWKTLRKIVVIESDDWGSIRMPSKQTYHVLEQKGLAIGDHYNRFDSLATRDDLATLFDVLSRFHDKNGNHPRLTANCVVANPAFEKIREDGFARYHYELFTDTLKRYPGCEGSFALWKQGQGAGVFMPQYHGREHLNVPLWMAALQGRHEETLVAFDHGFWGQTTSYPNARFRYFLAALDFRTREELEIVCAAVTDGYGIFEKIFGVTSKAFIAPNYVWSEDIEKTLFDCGCKFLQGQRNQLIPIVGALRCKTRFHFTGQRNSLGQRYLVRNANFEPSSDPNIDWVDICLRDIENAFLWKTPAIISSHRVNYIGAIVSKNRDCNLRLLEQLLQKIVRKWPDVEFMTSDQLGSQFAGGKPR